MTASVKPRAYTSDVAIPPGTVILEMLADMGITQAGLAERMKRPASKVNEILHGKRAITPDTALELELVLGIPAYVWLELESKYQVAKKRLELQEHMHEQIDTLRLFPVREMVRYGWIKKAPTPEQQAYVMLAYFGVASFSQLSRPSVLAPAFRKSDAREACPHALAAWLRKGELQAQKTELQPFDSKAIRASVGDLRALSLLPPEQFKPRLTELGAAHGLAVVLVPHLPRSYVSGAAYWIGDKAVIQLSDRFRTNDHFWFSFFHELGHILLHGKKETFLDDFKVSEDQKEHEANHFACRTLIPDSDFARLKTLEYQHVRTIKQFSQEIGIAPGVVVGRLQYEGCIPYQSFMNNLKVKLLWKPEVGADAPPPSSDAK